MFRRARGEQFARCHVAHLDGADPRTRSMTLCPVASTGYGSIPGVAGSVVVVAVDLADGGSAVAEYIEVESARRPTRSPSRDQSSSSRWPPDLLCFRQRPPSTKQAEVGG